MNRSMPGLPVHHQLQKFTQTHMHRVGDAIQPSLPLSSPSPPAPLPLPFPYHSSGSFQCTSPRHPVSCIKPGLVIHFIYDSIHVSMPFSQISPPSLPSLWDKTLESPLDCKEIQPVHSEGDQPWDFFGRNDAKAETRVLWPPRVKS